jgi:hypothetical protein
MHCRKFLYKTSKKCRRFFSVSFLSVLAILFLTSQHGEFTILLLEASPLEITQPVISPTESPDMLNRLGGITSVLTAHPDPDLRVQSLRITYHPSKTDGSRVELKINQNEVKCSIPDWQLLPIVQFVDSPYNACITLLGELANKEFEKQIKINNGYIVNYHPAFIHTLLGMYLLQNEISMLTDNAEINNINKKELISIQEALSEKHRSWILSDMNNEIFFSIHDDQLNISVGPEYYFWRYASDAPDMDKIKNEHRYSAMNRILQHEFEADLAIYNIGLIDDKSFRKIIRDRAMAVVPEMFDQHYSLAEANFDELLLRNLSKAIRSDKLKQSLNSLSTEELVETWTMAAQINTLYRVMPLNDYSEKINAEINVMHEADPEAWDATVNLMKYSSFFRYIKQSHPKIWKEFTTSLEGVDLKEPIQTPTAIYPSDNMLLEQLIN